MKYLFLFLFSLTLFLALIVGNNSSIKNSLGYIDWIFLDGFFSRSILEYEPRLYKKEITTTQFNFDYSWLEKEEFIFIAHRGGEYFESGQNTKKTIMNSINRSVSFIEIDLDFKENGNIVCVTGQDLNMGACNLEWLLTMIEQHSFFLIIDLKFNVHEVDLYKTFYENLIKTDSFQKLNCKIIPQAYNFQHLMVLKDLNYPTGPIFTTYRTNIPNSIVYEVLSNTSIKAMTIPFISINFLEGINDKRVSFFVHPINNQKDLQSSKEYEVKGIYTTLYQDQNVTNSLVKKEFTVCPNN